MVHLKTIIIEIEAFIDAFNRFAKQAQKISLQEFNKKNREVWDMLVGAKGALAQLGDLFFALEQIVRWGSLKKETKEDLRSVITMLKSAHTKLLIDFAISYLPL